MELIPSVIHLVAALVSLGVALYEARARLKH